MDRRRGATFIVPVALATLTALTSCGSDDASSGPAVGASFAKQAAAACKDASALKQAQRPFPFPDFNPSQPDPSKLPIIAPYLEETVHTFQAWLADLKALGEPPTGQDAWDDLVSDVQRHVEIATDQQQAAEDGDVATFVRDFEEGSATVDKVGEAADAAGVPSCSAVDR